MKESKYAIFKMVWGGHFGFFKNALNMNTSNIHHQLLYFTLFTNFQASFTLRAVAATPASQEPSLSPSHHTPVVSLSNHKLTPAQYYLLSKGISFCPTPVKTTHGKLREDLDQFHVSLHCQAFFLDNDYGPRPTTIQQ